MISRTWLLSPAGTLTGCADQTAVLCCPWSAGCALLAWLSLGPRHHPHPHQIHRWAPGLRLTPPPPLLRVVPASIHSTMRVLPVWTRQPIRFK